LNPATDRGGRLFESETNSHGIEFESEKLAIAYPSDNRIRVNGPLLEERKPSLDVLTILLMHEVAHLVNIKSHEIGDQLGHALVVADKHAPITWFPEVYKKLPKKLMPCQTIKGALEDITWGSLLVQAQCEGGNPDVIDSETHIRVNVGIKGYEIRRAQRYYGLPVLVKDDLKSTCFAVLTILGFIQPEGTFFTADCPTAKNVANKIYPVLTPLKWKAPESSSENQKSKGLSKYSWIGINDFKTVELNVPDPYDWRLDLRGYERIDLGHTAQSVTDRAGCKNLQGALAGLQVRNFRINSHCEQILQANQSAWMLRVEAQVPVQMPTKVLIGSEASSAFLDPADCLVAVGVLLPLLKRQFEVDLSCIQDNGYSQPIYWLKGTLSELPIISRIDSKVSSLGNPESSSTRQVQTPVR
jgi:hypothetical protein